MDADLGSNGRHIPDWPRLPRSSGAFFCRWLKAPVASARSVPRLCRRLSKLADRHDDAQPRVGALVIASAAHLLHHLARFRGRLIAMKLDEQMCRAVNVRVRSGHAYVILAAVRRHSNQGAASNQRDGASSFGADEVIE